MNGTLHYANKKPAVGAKVFIVVDDVNRPTGFWEGELTEVGGDYSHTEDNPQCPCSAIIMDAKVVGESKSRYFGKVPTLNYRVYEPVLAVEYLRECRSQDRNEITGLKKRLEIERGVYQAALKAMVSDSGFAKLEQLFKEFLAKLGR